MKYAKPKKTMKNKLEKAVDTLYLNVKPIDGRCNILIQTMWDNIYKEIKTNKIKMKKLKEQNEVLKSI